MRNQSPARSAIAATPSASPAVISPALPTPETSQEILDTNGVANLLGFTVKQVQERTRSRAEVTGSRIPHHAVGKRILFVRSEVLAWVMSCPPRQKKDYRLSPAGRKSLTLRNKQRRNTNQNSGQGSHEDRTAVSR
jgi:hypothetical protein